jgi:endonuclease/exonuclease/phosphatase (EEP) superfamily protein YafD
VKKSSSILRIINTVLFYTTIIIGLVSLLPGHWLPGVGILNIFFPFLIIPHFILAIFNIIIQPRLLIKSGIGIILLFIPLMAQLPLSTLPQPEEVKWKVASYNVQAFYQKDGAADDIALWVQEEGVDILCTQEMRRSMASPISEYYPYQVYAPENKKIVTAIHSKYPIVGNGPLIFDGMEDNSFKKYSAGFADIALPYDTIRIINIHLSSTGIKDEDMLIEPSREEWMEKSQFMAKKIASSDPDRSKQGESILRWIRSSPHPVILTGDFNSVPGGYLYASLLWVLDDPYIFSGSGSWGSYSPLLKKGLPLRIDWTLVDGNLPYSGQYLSDVTYSDHRPLVTTFSAFPGGPQ